MSTIEATQSEIESAKASSESWEQERCKRYDDALAGLASAEVELTEVELQTPHSSQTDT